MRHEAIYNTHPTVVSVDDGLGAFDENGNSVTIDEEKVTEEVAKLEANFKSKQYQRDRKQEYPSIEELVVALYDESDKASIIERRNAVKAKYPKPE